MNFMVTSFGEEGCLTEKSFESVEKLCTDIKGMSYNAALLDFVLSPPLSRSTDQIKKILSEASKIGPPLIVTARLFHFLPSEIRINGFVLTSAHGQELTLDSVPLYGIRKGPDASDHADPVDDRKETVVQKLLNLDPAMSADPLPVRLLNRFGVDALGSLFALSEEELARKPAIGRGTVNEFKNWVLRQTQQFGRAMEFAEVQRILSGQDINPEHVSPVSDDVGINASSPDLPLLIRQLPRCIREMSPDDAVGLSNRVRNCLTDQSISSFEAIESLSTSAMLAWPNFGRDSLKNLRTELLRLRTVFERLGGEAHMSTQGFHRRLLLETPLLQSIANIIDAFPERDQMILTKRIFSDAPTTLQGLATESGLTRERIRQIDSRLRAQVKGSGNFGQLVDARLYALRQGRSSPLTLSQLEAFDDWFARVKEKAEHFGGILRGLDCEHRLAINHSAPEAFVTLAEASDVGELVRKFRMLHRNSSGSPALQELASQVLTPFHTTELVPIVLAETADVVETETGIVIGPNQLQRVEAVLHGADGPLTINEIESRLRQVGIQVSKHSVRGCLERISNKVVNTKPSTYILASKLKSWDRYREVVASEVEDLMMADRTRQWRAVDILRDLADEGNEWAETMGPEVIDYLLRDHSIFQRLNRGMWCLASVSTSRRPVMEVGRDLLITHGSPMRYRELEQRIRERRSIGPNFSIRWPLVRLETGLVGLGNRDLGLSDEGFSGLRKRSVKELTSRGGRLNSHELVELLADVCPELTAPRARVLAGMLAIPPKVALDGNGDGIRLSDLPRETVEATATHDPNSVSAPESGQGPADSVVGKTVMFEDLLDMLEETTPFEEIHGQIANVLGVNWPHATLRMRLRAAGWTEENNDLWTRKRD
jgi:hypothetical protein